MRLLAWFLLVSVAAGCQTTEVTLDGGPMPDASDVEPGALVLTSAPALDLVTGEAGSIEVRLTRGSRPVVGAEVAFALIGTAHDTALEDLSVRTDAEGHARTSIVAGSVAAAFRVRASHGGAEPVFVNVAVAPEGFGTLRVITEHEGRRTGDTARVFRVYAETECDPPDGYPSFADRSLTIDAGDEDVEARWSLPVGLSYTVVAELRRMDVVLASGCVDGVTLTVNAETEQTVRLLDAPLRPDGRYDLTLDVQPGGAGTGLIERALGAGRASVGDSGAAYYLDALDAELRERGKEGPADALMASRAMQEARLGQVLGELALGPHEALNRLGARLEARAALVRLAGPLVLTAGTPPMVGAVWTLSEVTVGPDAPDAPMPVEVPLERLDMPAPRIELASRPGADVIDLEGLLLVLRLEVLVLAALDAEIAPTERPGMVLLDGAGCGELAGWIAAHPTVASECDAECASAVCARALDPLVAATRGELSGPDPIQERLELGGSLVTTDEDHDIEVDRVEARGLGGNWYGDTEFDAITADLVAQRRLE